MRVLVVVLLAFVSLAAATAPLLSAGNTIPNQYLVVFHRNSTVQIRDLHVAELERRLAAHEKIINRFDIGDLIGYSAVLSKETLATELEHANVRYIEADQIVTINEVTQTDATWGIDRIDQAALPLNRTYRYFASAGQGITVYVIDTGIFLAHNEFGGRAKFGTNTVDSDNQDGNGHGTHVAGTIGGTIYGVAKKVTLVAVKVLGANGSGTTTGVVGGVDWVTKDHKARNQQGRSVANMSLGGGASTSLDSAVAASIGEGVVYAVAAGNDNKLACNYSPARVATAITVGATTNTDARSSFSNHGTCLDLFAPGSSITAAWIGSNTAINTISGTSMAAPHVAGAAAVYLGEASAQITPEQVRTALVNSATKGVVTNAMTGSPNLLLYSPY
jgi:subtilisin family serine protease